MHEGRSREIVVPELTDLTRAARPGLRELVLDVILEARKPEKKPWDTRPRSAGGVVESRALKARERLVEEPE
ncbi:hypothetical protein HY251_05440 [bacterium]|nr:hypothetical protein [bacterium]